jgi:tRNA A58 N-methylase Trm61
VKATLTFIKILLLILTIAIVSGGCQNQDEVSLDLQKIADALMTQIQFDDTLYPVDSDLLSVLVGIDASETGEAIAYAGTGATAEEIVLLKFVDEDGAKAGYDALEAHLQSQKSDFEDYVPAEVARIDAATLERQGTYVLLCVTSESAKAEEIFKEAAEL